MLIPGVSTKSPTLIAARSLCSFLHGVYSTMNARSVRNELSKIRDVANEISSDMAKVLDKSMKPKERRDEAR